MKYLRKTHLFRHEKLIEMCVHSYNNNNNNIQCIINA